MSLKDWARPIVVVDTEATGLDPWGASADETETPPRVPGVVILDRWEALAAYVHTAVANGRVLIPTVDVAAIMAGREQL